MESVGDVLKRQPSRFQYQDLVQQIVKDPDVAAFIQKESLSQEELNRSISKFNQYITERDKFLRGDTDYIARGYKPILVMNHGYADVSYEVTGVPVVLGQALAAVHKAGECMVVSIWEREASINPNEFAIQEKSLKGIIAYRHIFPKVLELMEQGYFPADKLVTKKIKLENIVEKVYIGKCCCPFNGRICPSTYLRRGK